MLWYWRGLQCRVRSFGVHTVLSLLICLHTADLCFLVWWNIPVNTGMFHTKGGGRNFLGVSTVEKFSTCCVDSRVEITFSKWGRSRSRVNSKFGVDSRVEIFLPPHIFRQSTFRPSRLLQQATPYPFGHDRLKCNDTCIEPARKLHARCPFKFGDLPYFGALTYQTVTTIDDSA